MQTAGGIDIHLLIECIIGVASLASFTVVTLIKLAQSDDRSEMLQHQAAMKEELVAAQAQDRQNLAVHIAEDRASFAALGETLERIEKKL
jgi:hypothetical protein